MDDRLPVALIAVAAVLALMLCGCGTPWGNDIDRNELACQGYGFYAESPEFAECMISPRALSVPDDIRRGPEETRLAVCSASRNDTAVVGRLRDTISFVVIPMIVNS